VPADKVKAISRVEFSAKGRPHFALAADQDPIFFKERHPFEELLPIRSSWK
jgi:hypothetical protein